MKIFISLSAINTITQECFGMAKCNTNINCVMTLIIGCLSMAMRGSTLKIKCSGHSGNAL